MIFFKNCLGQLSKQNSSNRPLGIAIVVLCSLLFVSCDTSEKGAEKETLMPFTGHTVFVKEYVDSVQKFIYYASFEAVVGVCGYQFSYYSDSVYDPRVRRVISRFNDANFEMYKTNCSNSKLYIVNHFFPDNDTLNALIKKRFIVGNKEITIRKFKKKHGYCFYSDEYGQIESVHYYPKEGPLRIRLKSSSFLNKKEIAELQYKLRNDKIYAK